jgi:hypothetical protein
LVVRARVCVGEEMEVRHITLVFQLWTVGACHINRHFAIPCWCAGCVCGRVRTPPLHNDNTIYDQSASLVVARILRDAIPWRTATASLPKELRSANGWFVSRVNAGMLSMHRVEVFFVDGHLRGAEEGCHGCWCSGSTWHRRTSCQQPHHIWPMLRPSQPPATSLNTLGGLGE